MRKPVRRPAFEDACRTVARNLSENGTKVRVVFRGDGASTNGTTIFLPAGDQLSTMAPEDCGVLAGYVDHEAEHIASTDMDLWNSEIGKSDDFRREMANACEDMRIEKIAVRKNYGSFANLSDTTKNVCERELRELSELAELQPDVMTKKRFILPGAVTWEGRKRMGMHADLQQKLLDLVSPEIRAEAKRINDLVAKARDGRLGTHDVWEIAKKLGDDVDKTEPEEESTTPPPPGEDEVCEDGKGKGKPQDEEKDDETSDDGESDGDESDGEGDEEKGDEAKSEGDDEADGEKKRKKTTSKTKQQGNDNDDDDDGDGNKDGNDDQGGDDTASGDDDSDDEGEAKRDGEANGGEEAVESSLQEGDADSMGGRGGSLNKANNKKLKTREVSFKPVVNTPVSTGDVWVPFTTENDFVVNADTGLMFVYEPDGPMAMYTYPRDIFSPLNVQTYDELLSEIGPHLNTMRAKLRRALMTKLERRWDGGYTTGRLDPRRLVDAVRGVPEVFRRRDPENFIDTAVQIVVDLSGSMATNRRIKMAAQAAIGLANALEGTGVAYEVIGFQDPFFNGLTPELAKELRQGLQDKQKREVFGQGATFARYLPHMLVEFKPFNKRLRDCRAGLGGIASAAGGANNDIDALIYARERLMKREETRKVMLVLSDGKPAPVSDFDANWVEQMMRKTVAQIEDSRLIEVVGIGIQSDCVGKFYKHYSVLHSPEELPRTVIDQIARKLLGDRFQTDNAKLLGAA